jgi:hypothetical protein
METNGYPKKAIHLKSSLIKKQEKAIQELYNNIVDLLTQTPFIMQKRIMIKTITKDAVIICFLMIVGTSLHVKNMAAVPVA